MKLPVSFLAAVIAAVLIGTAGCSFTTAHFTDVTMAKAVDKDVSPVQKTTSFFKHDPILHCCALVANAPSDTKVKAVWLYKPEGKEVQRVDSVEIAVESKKWIDFTFRPAHDGLPYGNYTVDLFIDGKYKQSVPFTVKPMIAEGVVREAVIASQVNEEFYPTELLSIFSPDVPKIYLPVYAMDVQAGTIITARWYQRMGGSETELVTTNFPVDESSWTGWIGFSLKPSKPLPQGAYRAEILENGQSRASLEFTVK
jgi:hypothetical protein